MPRVGNTSRVGPDCLLASDRIVKADCFFFLRSDHQLMIINYFSATFQTDLNNVAQFAHVNIGIIHYSYAISPPVCDPVKYNLLKSLRFMLATSSCYVVREMFCMQSLLLLLLSLQQQLTSLSRQSNVSVVTA